MKTLTDLKHLYPQAFATKYISIPIGWRTHFEKFIQIADVVIEENGQQFNTFDKLIITQIKEKFGGLRVYYSFGTSSEYAISQLKHKAIPVIEELQKTCDNSCHFCGKPGKSAIMDNWLRVICDEPHKKDELIYLNPFNA